MKLLMVSLVGVIVLSMTSVAAEELKLDYSPVDFDGVTYWARG